METFVTKAEGIASGTDKTLINVFNPAAAPTSRGKVNRIMTSSVDTPDDKAAKFEFVRSTAVGTEGAGFTPNNIDPAGPAGAYDSGVGVFSVEPTYTASKELLVYAMNMRSVKDTHFYPGQELILAATQNNGAGLKTGSSTGTHAHEATIFFTE